MRRFTPESAAATIELQQLVADFFHEIDSHHGNNVSQYYTEDGAFLLGDFAYRGREVITEFYRKRLEVIRFKLKDGERTGRHAYTNLRVTIENDLSASIHFLNVQYSGEGKAPLELQGPTMVVDCRMRCRREADGAWRIAEFQGVPVFVGNDSFLNKMLIKS